MQKKVNYEFSGSTISVNPDVEWVSNDTSCLNENEIKELMNDPFYLMANDDMFVPIQKLVAAEKRYR